MKPILCLKFVLTTPVRKICDLNTHPLYVRICLEMLLNFAYLLLNPQKATRVYVNGQFIFYVYTRVMLATRGEAYGE